MDKELLMILAMTTSPLLYMLGGWKWKWLRRFVLPIILGVLLLLSGALWWKVLVFAILQSIALCLPYGERTPYWCKALVSISFVLPSLVFGVTFWQVLLPVVFIVTFVLSNKNKIAWKICEGLTGFLLGVIVARFIQGG